MTKQEIFDKALAALRKQTKRSGKTDDQGRWTCLYKDVEGNRCAVGHLMSEEDVAKLKDSEMGSPVASLISKRQQDFSHLMPSDIKDYGKMAQFMAQLQSNLHDHCNDSTSHELLDHDRMEMEAVKFAATWELVYTAPEAAKE